MAAAQTLLIVEDDEITRQGLAAVLANAGYAVATAGDAAAALAYLREQDRKSVV